MGLIEKEIMGFLLFLREWDEGVNQGRKAGGRGDTFSSAVSRRVCPSGRSLSTHGIYHCHKKNHLLHACYGKCYGNCLATDGEKQTLVHEREMGVYYHTGLWCLWQRRQVNYNEEDRKKPGIWPQILSE